MFSFLPKGWVFPFIFVGLALLAIYSIKADRERLQEQYTAELNQITALYEERIADQRELYEQLSQSMEHRQGELAKLDNNVTALQLQLSSSKSKDPSLSSSADRSDPSKELLNRRIAALEHALREATLIIKERDQCAIDYNALYKQCNGGANGRRSN